MEDNKTIKSRPKDFFLHFLAIMTLYISAVSFGTLVFQYVNYFFPDIASGYYPGEWTGAMRGSVASLIIVFPVYVGISAFLERMYRKEPELKSLRVRKWLINFTLFITALIIIGDLIFLINNFLNGELTARFTLKVLAVFTIALMIFSYYFLDLREGLPKTGLISERTKRWEVWKSIGLVCLFVFGSFFIMGSPFEARLRNIDARRVGDLQGIQWQVINYWQAKGVLPESLNNLVDPTRGVMVPNDPETSEPYEYIPTGKNSFKLCAVFKTVSSAANNGRYVPYPYADESWAHGEGRTCFDRSIDPDFYKPIVKPID